MKQLFEDDLNNVSGGKITRQQAFEIAAKDAGFDPNKLFDVDIDLEGSMGNPFFEVEFKKGGREYKYYISLATGEILDKYSHFDD